MSIEWGRKARDKVSAEIIKNVSRQQSSTQKNLKRTTIRLKAKMNALTFKSYLRTSAPPVRLKNLLHLKRKSKFARVTSMTAIQTGEMQRVINCFTMRMNQRKVPNYQMILNGLLKWKMMSLTPTYNHQSCGMCPRQSNCQNN